MIIPSGGSGERFGGKTPKPLVLLNGIPIVIRTLQAFEQHDQIDGIILVVHPDYDAEYKKLIRDFDLKKVKAIVKGGETRTQSVRVGLRHIPDDVTIVLTHDAVRPLLSQALIERSLDSLQDVTAAVAAVPVKSTLKTADAQTQIVSETLNRSLVWEVQTPQVFAVDVLRLAYQEETVATDDAMMVEAMGGRVKVFLGDEKNIKITTPLDLLIAESFLKADESV